jgi:hypothetical protein
MAPGTARRFSPARSADRSGAVRLVALLPVAPFARVGWRTIACYLAASGMVCQIEPQLGHADPVVALLQGLGILGVLQALTRARPKLVFHRDRPPRSGFLPRRPRIGENGAAGIDLAQLSREAGMEGCRRVGAAAKILPNPLISHY